jgi:predicted RNase H-like HicB family nuclease
MAEIRGHVRLHFRTFAEDGQWVGRCQELGISTCADTRTAAEAGIIEATTLYLETLADEGELERVLSEHALTIAPSTQSAALEEWEEQIPVSTGAV